jgi:hypothetical protein
MKKNTRISPPWLVRLLRWMLFAEGMMALAPGLMLVSDPSGRLVGFPEGSLREAPFSDYLIPGILLTVFMGILPLLSGYALWKQPVIPLLQRINPFPRRHWAWTAALVCGSALVIWILVQMTMIPLFFLQPVLLGLGIVILLLCFLPPVKDFYILESA